MTHTNERLIKRLRAAADLLEQNPDIHACGVSVADWREAVSIQAERFSTDAKASFAAFSRLCGRTDKEYDENFRMIGTPMSIGEQFELYCGREAVCKKVVTKRIEPAKPEITLPATPEREVEEVTWQCDDALLDTK